MFVDGKLHIMPIFAVLHYVKKHPLKASCQEQLKNSDCSDIELTRRQNVIAKDFLKLTRYRTKEARDHRILGIDLIKPLSADRTP